MPPHTRFYRGDYVGVGLEDFASWDEAVAHITDLQEELIDKLETVGERHASLVIALEVAIGAEVVQSDEAPDFLRYLSLYGDLIAVQREMADEGLRCLQLSRAALQDCMADIATSGKPERSDQLARQVDELTEQLFDGA